MPGVGRRYDLRRHPCRSVEQADVISAAAPRTTRSNLRAAVEVAIRAIKHPCPASRLPVRGQCQVTCPVITATLITNTRRIHRYFLPGRGLVRQICTRMPQISKKTAPVWGLAPYRPDCSPETEPH